MIVLTREQKQTLVRQGWVKIGNTLLLANKDTNVVEEIILSSKGTIRHLLQLTIKATKPIKADDYINTMIDIDKIERELKLYESDNAKIGL